MVEYIKDYKIVQDGDEQNGLEQLMQVSIEEAIEWAKCNVSVMRQSMGGKSKDITDHPLKISEELIEGYKEKIKLRIYQPISNRIRPIIIYCHGGGWFGGSLNTVDNFCKAISDKGDCVVISVDYHLAPEAKFPEGLEDCYSALKWVMKNSHRLNVDTKHIVVAGDSAGGNYAAVMSLLSRERGDTKIEKQILIYPATLSIPSEEIGEKDKLMSRLLSSLYLNDITDEMNPHVTPFLSKDLSNLPDALVVVGENDSYYKSTKRYAKALSDAGNKVIFYSYSNTKHGFIDNTGYCDRANGLVDDIAQYINSGSLGGKDD